MLFIAIYKWNTIMRRGIKLDIFLITFNKLQDFKFFSKILVKKTSEMMTRKTIFQGQLSLDSRKKPNTMWYIEHADSKDF